MRERRLETKVQEALNADDWPFEHDPPVFHTGFKGDNGTFRMVAWANDDEAPGAIVATAELQTSIPEAKWGEVAELASRLNDDTLFDTIYLDYGSGDMFVGVNFIVLDPDTATPELINHYLYRCALRADEVYPTLMSVIFGDRTPADAAKSLAGNSAD
jgi:hypothetical protein